MRASHEPFVDSGRCPPTWRTIDVLPWVLVLLLAAGCQRVDDPKVALARFYANEGPECSLKTPLFDGAPGVVPLVIEAIRGPGMPKRRYAIAFLGDVGAHGATGQLLFILEDGAEQDYFRADALQALQAVDTNRAREIAPRYSGASGLLGETARDIASGGILAQRKSAWARLWDRPCS